MISLIVTVLLGLCLLLALEKRLNVTLDSLLLVALSPLVGIINQAYFLFGLSILGIPWPSRWLILALETFIIALTLWLRRDRLIRFIPRKVPGVKNLPSLMLIGLLAAQLTYLSVATLNQDYLHGDALNMWFMKGKIFFLENSIPKDVLGDPRFLQLNRWGSPSIMGSFFVAKYPPLPSLTVAMVYLLEDGENIFTAKALWLLVHGSLLFTLWWFGQKLFGKDNWLSFSLPLLYLTIPVSWMHFGYEIFGTVDLWLATWFALAVIFLYQWLNNKEDLYAILSAFFAGAAGLTKAEGAVGLVVIPIILWLSFKAKRFNFGILPLLLSVVPPLMWWWFSRGINLPQDFFSQILTQNRSVEGIVTNLEMIGSKVIGKLFDFSEFGLLWIFFFTSLVYLLFESTKRNRRIHEWLVSGIVMTGLLSIIGAYLLVQVGLESHIAGSITRLLSQWTPTALVVGVTNSKSYLKRNK